MRKLIVLAALVAAVSASSASEAKAINIWGRGYNPAGNICTTNCRFFLHDFTANETMSWPALVPALALVGANMHCYVSGGALCYVAESANLKAWTGWTTHNFEVYMRFVCADGHFKYTVHKSLAPRDIYPWWMGTFTFSTSC